MPHGDMSKHYRMKCALVPLTKKAVLNCLQNPAVIGRVYRLGDLAMHHGSRAWSGYFALFLRSGVQAHSRLLSFWVPGTMTLHGDSFGSIVASCAVPLRLLPA